MVIEWLRFRIKTELRESFIERDREVWVTRFSKKKGYLGKEVWIDTDISSGISSETSDVIFVIRWESMEAWKAIPQTEIDNLNKLMGDLLFPVAESHAYQVRRFLH
jgi:uncharacterized protein (TIGR03792 family)